MLSLLGGSAWCPVCSSPVHKYQKLFRSPVRRTFCIWVLAPRCWCWTVGAPGGGAGVWGLLVLLGFG